MPSRVRKNRGYEEMKGDTDLTTEQGTTSPTTEDSYTLSQAVDTIGFGWFQIKLSLFTGLVWMADAMEMMILAILSPALRCAWNIESWKQATLTTVVFAGMMVSSSFWGKVCDKYGRKTCVILCASFTFYFGLLSSFSPNYVWILILRGLVGFGIGGAPQSITLYSEFLPSKSRAKCVVFIEVFWAIGCTFIVVLSLFIMPTLGWRYLLGIASLPCLVLVAACVWLPESARYDMTRGETLKALATLERIAKENGKPMPLGRLVEQSSSSSQHRGRMKDLLTTDMYRTTLLLWFIWLANAFSYYGVVLMTTELLKDGDTCSASHDIQKLRCVLACKDLTTKDYVDLLWTTLAEFPGLVVTFLFIECAGRKLTMSLEFFIFSLFTFLLCICSTRTVMTLLIFVARAFISGAFQAAYVYTPEVYPTSIRAVGLGTCSGMARVGALVTPFVAQVMLEHSIYLAVSIYGSICVLGGIASLLLPIETKGRELSDVIAIPKLGPSDIIDIPTDID